MALERDPFTGGKPLPQFIYERTPGAASEPLSPRYRPTRHPENAPLYRVVYHGLEDFLAQAAASGSGYPSFIEKEFRKFLGCKSSPPTQPATQLNFEVTAATSFTNHETPICGARDPPA